MFKAYFLNQGRVDSILLECDGEYAFVDGGYRRNGKNAVDFMLKNGITRLKYYVGTHGHKNHIAAAAPIIGGIKTDFLVVPRKKVLDAIIKYSSTMREMEAINDCSVRYIRKGEKMYLGHTPILCIGPDKQIDCSTGAYKENYNSLILRVDYGETDSILLTGDTSAAIIAKCGSAAKARVLKSPHHAGSQPLSLLKQVQPKDVVVCSNVRAGKAYRNRISQVGANLFNTCDTAVTVIIL